MEQATRPVPLTAKEALNVWDLGEAVPAFQVEATPDRQHVVYAAAFEIIRGEGVEIAGLSERETAVAESIAHVAQKNGWAKMVSTHIHPTSPAITVKKPKE